jgi:hypothetical protein
MAGESCAVRGGRDRRRQHPNRRGFASAVRTEQAQRLPCFEVEVDPIHGLDAALICLAQSLYLDSLHLGISPVSVVATYARAAPVSSAQLRNRY